jgi:diadenosine tetraphosphatase ApaH/serine/threonine PP2A family protein phosphatase
MTGRATWIVSLDSLSSSPQSPNIGIPPHSYCFKLCLGRSSASSIALELSVVGSISGQFELLISVVVVHPDGPASSRSFPFAEALNPDRPSARLDLLRPLDFFQQNNFFSPSNEIQFSLSISQMLSSPGEVLSFPNPADIISMVLAPHDITKVCPISNSDANWLLFSVSQVFLSQPCLLRLGTPIIVVGDLHGRFVDLLRIFLRFGFPDVANYLFLGDLVDRGQDSTDIILLLMAFKLLYPQNLFILRGNHESKKVTSTYGFRDECTRKATNFEAFCQVFDSLPIAAIIAGKIFCVHAGISPTLRNLAEIENFGRPAEVSGFGPLNDLLWSDPRPNVDHYCYSVRRGTSYQFGAKAAKKFLHQFGFELVIRAHEVEPGGFDYPFGKEVPVVTVFSATHYEGYNDGAVMIIDNDLKCSVDKFESLKTEEREKLERLDFNLFRNLHL